MKKWSFFLFMVAVLTACSDPDSCSATNTGCCPCDCEKSDSSSTIVGDSFTDVRDGKKYKVVTIGDLTWMAENLNYQIDQSSCYNDDPTNCEKYGRLYTWVAALGKTEEECGVGHRCFSKKFSLKEENELIQGICPKGWHLPSNEEWEYLRDFVGGATTAGITLRSTSGWIDYNGNADNGSDDYGFSAFPMGYFDSRHSAEYEEFGSRAAFWSSSERNEDEAFSWYLTISRLDDTDWYKNNKAGIRCVLDW